MNTKKNSRDMFGYDVPEIARVAFNKLARTFPRVCQHRDDVESIVRQVLRGIIVTAKFASLSPLAETRGKNSGTSAQSRYLHTAAKNAGLKEVKAILGIKSMPKESEDHAVQANPRGGKSKPKLRQVEQKEPDKRKRLNFHPHRWLSESSEQPVMGKNGLLVGGIHGHCDRAAQDPSNRENSPLGEGLEREEMVQALRRLVRKADPRLRAVIATRERNRGKNGRMLSIDEAIHLLRKRGAKALAKHGIKRIARSTIYRLHREFRKEASKHFREEFGIELVW